MRNGIMKKLLIMLAVIAFSATNVQAGKLYGQIQLVGGASYITDTSGNITGIDMGTFFGGGNGAANGTVNVGLATTGVFATLFPTGTAGTIKDIDLSLSSISPLWTVGTVSFSMTSFTSGAVASGFQVIGTGIITDSSGTYSQTDGYFSLNTTNTNTSVSFNFDAKTVPEPGTIALFGLGLLGFGFARIKARKS